MCYDSLTLSAYIDGELGSIESSEIGYHINICNKCSEKVNRLEGLHQHLKVLNQSENSLMKDTVWTRIVHSTAAGRELGFWHRGFVFSPSLLFGISFLFLSVAGLSLIFVMGSTKNNNIKLASNDTVFSSEKYPLDIPVDRIEKVLSYFNIHDEAMEVSIQLPDPSSFTIQGEPRFLRKVDYVAGR